MDKFVEIRDLEARFVGDHFPGKTTKDGNDQRPKDRNYQGTQVFSKKWDHIQKNKAIKAFRMEIKKSPAEYLPWDFFSIL